MVDWGKLTEQKVEEGREENRIEARLTSIMSLMKTLKWSAKQAMDVLKISKEEHQKYVDLLTNEHRVSHLYKVNSVRKRLSLKQVRGYFRYSKKKNNKSLIRQ